VGTDSEVSPAALVTVGDCKKPLVDYSAPGSGSPVFAKFTGVDHAADSSWTALRMANRQSTSGLGYPSAAAEEVRFQMRLAVAEFHDAREDLVGQLRSDLKR